jgi:hypothetical protein
MKTLRRRNHGWYGQITSTTLWSVYFRKSTAKEDWERDYVVAEGMERTLTTLFMGAIEVAPCL